MNEDKLVDIETRIAFQDKVIRELNEVVCKQQDQIDELSKICKDLVRQIRKMTGVSNALNPKDERPPHY